MNTYYKLTDNDSITYNNTRWGEGVTHRGTGEGSLCNPGWIHVYTSPLLAVFLSILHTNFSHPLLWEGVAEGKVNDGDYGLKLGVEVFTTLKQIPLPEVTTEQRIAFGILCALEVYTEPGFATWAHKWLSGEDRTKEAAEAAARAARAAARGAARAAARAARAARTAANTERATAWAASAVAWAAGIKNLNLQKIALKTLEKY